MVARREKSGISLIREALQPQKILQGLTKTKDGIKRGAVYGYAKVYVEAKALRHGGLNYAKLHYKAGREISKISSLESDIDYRLSVELEDDLNAALALQKTLKPIEDKLNFINGTRKQWLEVVEGSTLTVNDLDEIEELTKKKEKIEGQLEPIYEKQSLRNAAKIKKENEISARRKILNGLNDEITLIRRAALNMER